ncbi:cohesin domain-containing protein [Marinicrinis lubricantis]|uniref:Cohesin domain-containing protein n=1 Tax=Marinicrinis lubricantis TaxID=2086470 RepID=A0ABW1ILD4_9BACL
MILMRNMPKWVVMLLAAALLLCIVPTQQAQAAIRTTFGEPIEIGQPLESDSTIAIYDSVVGQEDGHNVLYTTLSGEPAQFNVINLDTYEVIRAIPLPLAKDSWTHVISPDGSYVYIASNQRLYRYSTSTKEIEDLGVIVAGETAIYGLSVDESGTVYGGTYPNAKVWRFDPETKQFSDYGRMSETNSYVRSLAFHDGAIYAGIGSTGSIVKLDPVTGEKTVIPLPPVEEVTGGQYPYVYNLDVVDQYLFAHLSGGGLSKLIVYDLELEQWRTEQFNNFHGNRVSQPMNGKAYFKLNGNGGLKLVELDLASFETRELKVELDFSMKGGGWAYINGNEQLPGATLVSITFDGRVAYFNIETETAIIQQPIVKGLPVPIQALEKGPDGRLYMSGYPGGKAAIYDPETQETELFTMGQAESIGFIGDKALFNVYPKAHIYELDTTLPIDETNPKELFQIGEEQDRPYVNLTAGSTMYMGTIPDYGKLGGALVVYDSASTSETKHKVFRNIVQDQSIVGLAYKDGKIYGSTSIYGGLDSDTTASLAKMFVWDTAAEEKIAEFTPELLQSRNVPMISGLTFGPDGLLWAAANGTIFALDPDTYEVEKSVNVYPETDNYGMWRPIHIRWGADGLLYTDLAGRLTVIDPDTLEAQSLGMNTALFTLGDDGNIYYSQSTRLYMIPVTSGEDTEPTDPPLPHLNVMNGSFEQTSSDGSIPGWSYFFSEETPNISYSISSEKAYSGSNSLKITDTSSNESVALASDPIAVVPGEAYDASVQLFIESGRSSVLWRFYDAEGKQVGSDTLAHIQTGQGNWQEVKLSAVAPDNAVTARMFASCSLAWMTTAYYDDFNINGKFPGEEPDGAGMLQLSVPSNPIYVNGTIDLTASVKNAGDLYAVDATLLYDAQKFTVERIEVSESFKSGHEVLFQSDMSEPGIIQFIASQLGDHAVRGDIDVAVVTFRALSPGDTQVILSKESTLAQSDADVTNELFPLDEDIIASISIGTIPGDFDGSGSIELYEIVAVAKRIGGAYDAVYDLNGDGQVDVADLSMIVMVYMEQ